LSAIAAKLTPASVQVSFSCELAEFLAFIDPTYATAFLIKDLNSIRRGNCKGVALKGLVRRHRIGAVLLLFSVVTARAEVASVYGGSDGLCGHKTASGERLNCAAMTAAHRRLPFGSQIRVCRSGCVTVRINDRGPWVRGRDIDLSPAAARAIGLYKTGHVTMSAGL
jgi:peptidoglycan lytic transglycosylase